jgi:hypothetical protein
MDEQSLNEHQPKVRRAGRSDGTEEPRPSVTRAESTGQAEQKAPENFSEKLLSVSEEASRATSKGIIQVESMLQWPLQATQRTLGEWTHFFGRTLERNARAAGDLRACRSVASVLRWQRDLVQGNVEDWLQTSFASWAFLCRRFLTPRRRLRRPASSRQECAGRRRRSQRSRRVRETSRPARGGADR